MKLFAQMRKERIPPNTVTFATAIAACAHAREFEQVTASPSLTSHFLLPTC